jgi:hypothetical protein
MFTCHMQICSILSVNYLARNLYILLLVCVLLLMRSSEGACTKQLHFIDFKSFSDRTKQHETKNSVACLRNFLKYAFTECKK